MKRLALLLVLAVASNAYAETIVRGKTIIVTDNIPAEHLPAFIQAMNSKQFEAWAKRQNENAYAAAKERHAAYLAGRGPLKTMRVREGAAVQSKSTVSRYSRGAIGSVGYGSGYLSPVGSRTGQAGSTATTIRDNFVLRDYVKTYPDLNDNGGGPVSIINPFCFEFWRLRTN